MVLAAAVATAAPQPARAQAQAARTAPAVPLLGELSASFEALATRVSPSVVQVIASGLVVDPDAATPTGWSSSAGRRARAWSWTPPGSW